jgi:hypothetical protein
MKAQKPEKLKFKPQGSELSQVLELEAWDFSGAYLGFGSSSARQL